MGARDAVFAAIGCAGSRTWHQAARRRACDPCAYAWQGNNGPYEIRDRGGQGDDDRAFGDDGDDTINVADGDSNDYGSCGAGSDDTLRVGSRAERDKFTGCVKSTSTRITSAAR